MRRPSVFLMTTVVLASVVAGPAEADSPVTLSGVLRTSTGIPVTDEVIVYQDDTGRVLETRTDPSGRYTLGVPDGSGTVGVADYAFGPGSAFDPRRPNPLIPYGTESSLSLTVAGDTVQDLTLAPYHLVTVQVLDRAGAPVPDVAVQDPKPGARNCPPPNGTGYCQFRPTGVFSPHTDADGQVVLPIYDGLTVTVASARGNDTGAVTVGPITADTRATIGYGKTFASLALTPTNPQVLKGDAVSFTVSGVYPDGSRLDVTDRASLTSSRPRVAADAGGGVVSALRAGRSTITATADGFSVSTRMTVRRPRS